jgi:hypothetical protein
VKVVLKNYAFATLRPLYSGKHLRPFHHSVLWTNGIDHDDISLWNLMWDPLLKVGVLNDFN